MAMGRRRRRRQVDPARARLAAENLAASQRPGPGPTAPPQAMTPQMFATRGPKYRQAVRELNEAAGFAEAPRFDARPTLPADPNAPAPLVREGRQWMDWKAFYAAPGATGIEKMANMKAAEAAALRGPAAPVLKPLRKEQRRGIQEALDSVRGEDADLKKMIDQLDTQYSPETLAAVPGYTAYKTREAAGVEVESDDQRRVRHIRENMDIVAQAKKLAAGGDERASQMMLGNLNLDTLNPRIRGEVEEIINSPILTWVQKTEEVGKAIRFGTTGKMTEIEKQEDAERKERAGQAEAREKELAKERSDEWTRREKIAARDMGKADKAVVTAEKVVTEAKAVWDEAEATYKNDVNVVNEKDSTSILDPDNKLAKAAAEDAKAAAKKSKAARDKTKTAHEDAEAKHTAAKKAAEQSESTWRRSVSRTEDIPGGPGGEEEQAIVNPKTGERRVLRNGKWVPVERAQPKWGGT